MDRRKLSVLTWAALVAGTGAIAAYAGSGNCSDPFYAQNPDPAGSLGHISRNNTGGATYSRRRIADDFTLTEVSSLAVIRFWGGDETDMPTPPNDNVVAFNFRIYAANGPDNGPGTTLWEIARTLEFDTTATPTGNTVGTLNAPEFGYRVEIVPPLILPPGDYFLSIGAYHFDNTIDADTETWQWSIAPGPGDGVMAEDRFNQQGMILRTDVTGTDMAFTLEQLAPDAACLGDLDGDYDVDLNDLTAVLLFFGTANIQGDADGDGMVDLNDLTIVLSRFGLVCDPC